MSKFKLIFLYFFVCIFFFGENLEDIKAKVKTIPENPGFWSEWDMIKKNVLSARHNKSKGYTGSWAKVCSLEDDYVFDKIILIENQVASISASFDRYYIMYIKSQSTGALAGALGINPKDGCDFTFAGVDLKLNAWILSKDNALQCFSEYDTSKRYTVKNIKAIYVPKHSRWNYLYHWFWAITVTDTRTLNSEDVFLINPTGDRTRSGWFDNVGLGGKRIYKVKDRKGTDKIMNFFSKYKYVKNRRTDENGRLKYYKPIEWEEVK